MNEKVLIIPDFPNWALDKNAKDLVKYNKSVCSLIFVIIRILKMTGKSIIKNMTYYFLCI
jgi:hypothetical protein